MAQGVAKNTPETLAWLEQYPAVGEIRVTTSGLQFDFDEKGKPLEAPEGIYFDVDKAPF